MSTVRSWRPGGRKRERVDRLTVLSILFELVSINCPLVGTGCEAHHSLKRQPTMPDPAREDQQRAGQTKSRNQRPNQEQEVPLLRRR